MEERAESQKDQIQDSKSHSKPTGTTSSFRDKLALPENPNVHRPTSLVVTHLPKDVDKRDIMHFLGEVGQVRSCHLVRDKDWNFKGMVYVQYTHANDAERAQEILNKKQFMGHTLRVKFSRNLRKEKLKLKQEKEKQANTLKDEHFDEEFQERRHKRKGKDKSKYEACKEARRLRQGRIIVRNLSFKITEKLLEQHFKPYGKINEVNIIRKKDNKLAGYAFLQYETRIEALKAIRASNMKPLLGRPVVVDLAVPKKVFELENADSGAIKEENVDVKEEQDEDGHPIDFEKVKVKEEKMDDDEDTDSGMEDKNDSGVSDDDGEDSEEEDDSDDDEEDDSDDDEEDDSDDDEEDDSDDDSDEEDDDRATGKKKRKPDKKSKVPVNTTEPSKDVVEERTIFIKNLNFDASEEDISEVLSQFGEVKSVVLVFDKLTEHPRGTAFAQFKKKESADACIAAESDPASKDQFILLGRPMHIMKAVSRKNLNNREDEASVKKVSDKRNLYLAREGFIRPGTQAAIGVSSADMALRSKREVVKRRMLKNLNVFVSATRLCVNNLPENMTDLELRNLFKKHGGPGSWVTEARVMKNLQQIGDDGKPKSRGYGFVAFVEHENALQALRTLNNNPDIFTNGKRPIIEFSMENKEILHAREKRLEKSKLKNPNAQKKEKVEIQRGNKDVGMQEDGPSFMGSKGDPNAGVKNALLASFGAKVRSDKGRISRKVLKKQRLELRNRKNRKRLRVMDDTSVQPVTKKSKEEGQTSTKRKNESKKKPVSKISKAELRQEKSFNDMVMKYKKSMTSSNPETSSKRWYED